MASTYLSRTISSSGNRKIMTFSAWIKRAINGATSCIFATGTGSERDMILFESDGKLQFSRYNSGYNYILKTNRQFRDTTAWYHLMCVLDTTQGTESNRAKIYVNGVQETSFNTATYPSQDYQTNYNQNTFTQYLGQDSDGNFDFDGCMSHVHYVDGTAYTPSTFGSTDATTGEWKINTSPTVTYGTNGFFLLKDDNAVTDRSGEGNNFAVGAGTLTKTEDNPSNIFPTFNANNTRFVGGTGTNGSTTWQTNNSDYSSIDATLGASSGKYYWEFKCSARSGSENLWHIGIKSAQNTANSHHLGYYATDYAYQAYNGNRQNNNTGVSYGSTYTVGDIIGVAMDLDNNRLFFSKNGTWQASGDPTSSTGAITITDPASTPFGFYIPAFSFNDGSGNGTVQANFGNGYFGTTAVSSAGTNASNLGIFEYDVPTGYTALCTKGLNE